MKYGLLGRKLGHSYSPVIHTLLGSAPYELFEREPEDLERFLREGDFDGINVTVPYKKAVIPYLDELSPVAARLGAVNTVVRRDGKLIGHNTDCFGFLTMVRSSGLDVKGKKVLVLGSGGASNTAVAVLQDLGANVVIISRTGQNNYTNLHLHADAAVIVNTTPVGMYPETDQSPVELSRFPRLEGVLDVIYNPASTALLRQARHRGITACNGLLMLVAQAKEASEWFRQVCVADSEILRIHRLLKQKMENIILIGMPGCGKSTVGRLLAEMLGKPFADADKLIEETAGKPIPEIFAREGEDAFRKLETEALAALCKRSGLVIATGGGCVTREENLDILRQNGRIFWLQRDVDKLPVSGRPLSQKTAPQELYRMREPMYRRFADRIICNNNDINDTLAEIRARWEETI